MADPVALQIQPPGNPLSSVLSTAQGFQNLKRSQLEYQQGQQALDTAKQDYLKGNIDLQKADQINKERINLQTFMSDPNNWQTDGRIDLNKINKTIPQIAPLTGGEAIKNITAIADAQTTAITAKRNMTKEARSIVAGPIGVLGRAGVTDPKIYAQELQALKTLYPDDQEMGKLVDSYATILAVTPPGKTLSDTAIRASQGLMEPTQQQSTLSPTAGAMDVGGEIKQTVTTPAVGGNAPSLQVGGTLTQKTLAPGGQESTEQGPDGNTYVVRRDARGNIVSSRPVPGARPVGGQPAALGTPAGGMPSFAPGQKADIENAQKEVVGIRAAGDQVPTARNINQEIIRLSYDASSGPGTSRWKAVLGGLHAALPHWAVSDSWKNVDSYQELGKFLEKNAIQAMQAMGGQGSDARLEAAVKANGSTEFNPGALREVTRFNDAANTGLDMYRKGVDAAVGLSNSDYTRLPQFKSDWAKNMDIEIFRVQNAIRDGDKDELVKIRSRLGPERMKELGKKWENIKKLSETGKL